MTPRRQQKYQPFSLDMAVMSGDRVAGPQNHLWQEQPERDELRAAPCPTIPIRPPIGPRPQSAARQLDSRIPRSSLYLSRSTVFILKRGRASMTVVRRFLLVCAILALPGIGYAQDAVLNGTVSDSTGGMLPGVTVTATLEATGNKFPAATDAGGHFSIPVRVGVYAIVFELSGFTTVTRTGVQVLLGQTVTITAQMK